MIGILENRHWLVEDYKQRVTSEQWREMLLNETDHIIYHGKIRQLKADNLGYGVVEIYKEPLKEGMK